MRGKYIGVNILAFISEQCNSTYPQEGTSGQLIANYLSVNSHRIN